MFLNVEFKFFKGFSRNFWRKWKYFQGTINNSHLRTSNIITVIVIAWIISISVHVFHMMFQFFIINCCEIIATRFNTINLVFGINCTPVDFTFEQYLCIFNLHSKIFYLLDEFFWNIDLPLFSFFLWSMMCPFDAKFFYRKLKFKLSCEKNDWLYKKSGFKKILYGNLLLVLVETLQN